MNPNYYLQARGKLTGVSQTEGWIQTALNEESIPLDGIDSQP